MAVPITHIVDRHGDLLIVLKNANAPFAVHDESDPKVSTIDTTWGVDAPPPWLKDLEKAHTNPEPTYVVSENRLRRFSPFLDTHRPEFPSAYGPPKVDIHGLDEVALLILLNTAHGKNIPSEMPTMMIGKLAIAFEYLKARVQFMWLRYLFWTESNYEQALRLPARMTRPLVVLLKVSLESEDSETFKKCVAAAIQHTDGLLPTLGLNIPQALIDRIDYERKRRLRKIALSLHRLVQEVTHADLQLTFGDILDIPAKNIVHFPPLPDLPLYNGNSCAGILERARGLLVTHKRLDRRPYVNRLVEEERVSFGALTYAQVAATPTLPKVEEPWNSAALCYMLERFLSAHKDDGHNLEVFTYTRDPSCRLIEEYEIRRSERNKMKGKNRELGVRP